MKLIGINGGTFDPIHNGHLRAALEVQVKLDLEEVRFIPCYQPVHRDRPMVSAQQRCEMVELAIQDQPKFTLDRIEVERGGPSYMVDTLATLKQKHVDAGLVLMMGTDAFSRFHTWHNWQEILRLANVAVMHRPGDGLPLHSESGQILRAHQVVKFTQPSEQIVDVLITQLDVSSTAVRSHLQNDMPVDYLLPPQVNEYIKMHKLYQ
ncbi:MAG: nicotinate-nucleotide adenylyltransferase [Pseudomonadota bacterium]|nr:nicotinate-nucleotide adenylyltransferase [Pseudomonadota bacterium]